MKDLVKELETVLDKVYKSIEEKVSIGKMNLDEFDQLITEDPQFLIDTKENTNNFRQTIIEYNSTNLADNKNIRQVERMLTITLKKIQELIESNTGIADSNKNSNPNSEIRRLINDKVLKPHTPVFGSKNGKTINGFLTKDGYLELTINGSKRKFGSLRFAALAGWNSDIQSQWKFWKVKSTDLPLEYYRNL